MSKLSVLFFSVALPSALLCALALYGTNAPAVYETLAPKKTEDSCLPDVQPCTALPFSRPLSAGEITSVFGIRNGANHTGTDIAVPEGTPILAACDGTVLKTEEISGYGNTIILEHKDGFSTLYAHCSAFLCGAGDSVLRGSVIALSGNTGNSTGPHLHFEIRKDGIPLNPSDYITF